MKKLCTPILAVLLTVTTQSAFAGWPVTVIADIPTQMNQMVNHAQSLKDYAVILDQLENMRQQYEQLQRDYESATGSRNLGNILKNPLLDNYIPDSWQDVERNIRRNGYEGLSGAAKALRNTSRVFDACEYIHDAQAKRTCAAKAVRPVQEQTYANQAYDKSAQRSEQIDALMDQINATTDPKSIAELNARITSELVMMQNEQTKLDMYMASAKAEKALLEQQTIELNKKTWSSRNYGTPIPPFTIGG